MCVLLFVLACYLSQFAGKCLACDREFVGPGATGGGGGGDGGGGARKIPRAKNHQNYSMARSGELASKTEYSGSVFDSVRSCIKQISILLSTCAKYSSYL